MIRELFKQTALKRTIFFICSDVVLISLAIWLSFAFRFDGSISPEYFPLVIRIIVLAVVFVVPVFYFEKLYSFSWSYVSANEVISLFRGTTVAFIFLSIAIFISDYFPHFLNFPRSTLFTSYFMVFIFCSLLRFAKRIYLHARGFKNLENKERTLIVGAGDGAEQMVRTMIKTANSPYLPVGFLDDNPIKRGVKIHGLPVLGKISDMKRIVKTFQVKQLIIAIPSADNATIKRAVALGKESGLYKIKIAPSMSELIRGEVSLKTLRDVDVEDLLGRTPVDLDKKTVDQFIKGKQVLITGAAGSIGSELCRQVAKFKPAALAIVDQDETGIFNLTHELAEKFPQLTVKSLVADIQDEEKMLVVFTAFRPQIVFHAAAYKHVPLMQEQPDEAVKNNILGTKVLAKTSIASGVEKFIFISTDKAVNPTSVMGATKRVGEMICQAYNQHGGTKFISVRFGNVLNSRGSVIPIFKEQIRKGGPVQVTHPDMRRYFMLISEACLLVLQAGAMGKGGEVFVLDMGKPVAILDLAREMIKLSGFVPDKDIAIVFIGLRPGEKLFEEMLTAEEGVAVTEHQKIFMAKMAQVNQVDLEKKIEHLLNIVYKGDKSGIIDSLKTIIPYYTNHA